MSRDISIVIEHIAGTTFRAILFEHEDNQRQVFDIIEGNASDLPGHLRHRKKQGGMDWNATVSARCKWWAGRASRFDVLVTRALQGFRMPDGGRRPRQDRTGGMMRDLIELVGAILALALILHLIGF